MLCCGGSRRSARSPRSASRAASGSPDPGRKAAENKVLVPIAKPKPKAVAGAPKLTRGETSVIVLNGNGRAGAAATAAERVRGIGYTIGTVGNAPRADFTRTLVMYRPGHEAE